VLLIAETNRPWSKPQVIKIIKLSMTLILITILVALIFEYINGFHDTANAIATVVATKVLTPRKAILLASITNLLGAMTGTAVATTIGSGLVDTSFVTTETILCGLIAGITWNLITWWWGLPSSSSHALIGGIIGTTFAKANNDINVIKFVTVSAEGKQGGLLYKVIFPMIGSPVLGFIVSIIVMGIIYGLIVRFRPKKISKVFKRLQIGSSAWVGFSHGLNDAQKTMGIIALLLMTGAKSGAFNNCPDFLKFMIPTSSDKLEITTWMKITCATVMGLGTLAGGWRIVNTLGHKIVFLKPVNGFAAECSAALIIQFASTFGIPLSTTHVTSSCIVGVGTAKKLSSANWIVINRMLVAWIFTIPICSTIGYVLVKLFVK